MTDDSLRQRFWDNMCDLSWSLSLLLGLNIMLLVALAISALFIEPGSATYYVNIFSLVIILSSLVLVSAVLYHCRRRERKQGQWNEQEHSEQQ